MTVHIRIVEAPGPAERDAVLGPLMQANTDAGYPSDMAPVAVLLEDEAGRTVGGLWGKTVYGWLFVEYLVVPEALRGRDLGTELMGHAEAIAVARGCAGAWLTTFTFQARSFYEKLGFEVFGELGSSPGAETRLFLRKRFAS